MGAKPEAIREFVLEHAPWILRTWKKFELRRASLPPPPRYTSGEMHPYLGQVYPVEVESGRKASVMFLSDRIRITTKGEPTAENVRKLLDRFYRGQAKIVFRERLGVCHQKVPKDIPLPPLRIRPMKTRWGTFSSWVRVTLNLWLVTMSVEHLDYVILHELCHFKTRRHGPRFWNLLERMLPDCKRLRRELNTGAASLVWR
jgi:hypothetical protein